MPMADRVAVRSAKNKEQQTNRELQQNEKNIQTKETMSEIKCR